MRKKCRTRMQMVRAMEQQKTKVRLVKLKQEMEDAFNAPMQHELAQQWADDQARELREAARAVQFIQANTLWRTR